MGQNRKRYKINLLPSKYGLQVSGHQQDIPEGSLWRAVNVVADMDGLSHKRPSLTQWGQTLKQPNPSATDSTITFLADFLSDVGTLVDVDGSSGSITTSVTKGYLQYNVPISSGSETYTHYQPGSTSSTKWGLRASLQGVNLPAYDGGTTANGLVLRAIGAAGTGKEFVLWSDGLYYKRAADSKYTMVAGTDYMGQGGWNTVEILCDDGGNTLVYLDDTLIDTIASSLFEDATLTSGALFETQVRVEGSGDPDTQYNARVAMLQYNDIDQDAFAAQTVVAIKGFIYVTSAGSSKRVLVCAAGDYIYLDRMEGCWRPLHTKTRTNVLFATYEGSLLWSDNNGAKQASIWKWNGTDDPELLKNAPSFVCMAEHQKRLIGADRKDPLLLKISGYGNPDRYIDSVGPEDDPFDLALDAASIPIPTEADAIVAIRGDYYDSAIIWTTRSVWRLEGTGVFSYKLTNISQDDGAVNAFSYAPVGNDILYAGYYDLHSLQTTNQYGDIKTQSPSLAIQAMWQQGSRIPSRVNRQMLANTRLASLPTRGLVYVHLPVDSQNQIMVYNVSTQQWYGPWDIESLAMAAVEIEAPLMQVVMHGGSSGKVAYTDFSNHADYGTAAISSTWEYANLNGRSLDPAFVSQVKSWKVLRLLFFPRGAYDYSVDWYAAVDEDYRSETKNQSDGYPALTLDNQMRVDMADIESIVYSAHELMVAEVDLDVRGLFLNISITDDELGSDLGLFGCEVEFEVDGVETE